MMGFLALTLDPDGRSGLITSKAILVIMLCMRMVSHPGRQPRRLKRAIRVYDASEGNSPSHQ